MKKARRTIALVLLVALLVLPLAALAWNGDLTVYVTRTGEKYHKVSCSYLRSSKIEMTLQEAVDKGYTPCSRCAPPKLSGTPPATPTPVPATPKPAPTPAPVPEEDAGGTPGGVVFVLGLIIGGAAVAIINRKTKQGKRKSHDVMSEVQKKLVLPITPAGKEELEIRRIAGVPFKLWYIAKDPDVIVYINPNNIYYHTKTCYGQEKIPVSITAVGSRPPCPLCKPGGCPKWLIEYKKLKGSKK